MNNRFADAAEKIFAISEQPGLDPEIAATVRMDASYLNALQDTVDAGGVVPLSVTSLALSMVPHWKALLGCR